MSTKDQAIVFFDGYCGLCSGIVDFLIERDGKRRLLYSPLQGETARQLLSEAERTDLDTLIVARRKAPEESTVEKFRKSDAVFECMRELGGVYKVTAQIAQVIPRFVRDATYDLVAGNRFKLFGKRDSCRLPSASERALFLP